MLNIALAIAVIISFVIAILAVAALVATWRESRALKRELQWKRQLLDERKEEQEIREAARRN